MTRLPKRFGSFGRSSTRSNHALRRTRPSRHCCNRGVPWAGLLSLGRQAAKKKVTITIAGHVMQIPKSLNNGYLCYVGLRALSLDGDVKEEAVKSSALCKRLRTWDLKRNY
jgi:hypothetical protein